MPPVEIPTSRLDYVSPRIWTAYVRDIPLPGDHITEQYLPMQDVEADRIFEEIGKYAKPMAPFWDQDAEAPQIDRGAQLTSVWFDAFWIKFKERFRGSDLRWLRMYGDRPVTDPAGRMADVQRRRITEAMDDLNGSVDTRIEWMRMQALLGRITQAPNVDSDVDVDISYPVTAVTPTVGYWDDTENADPVLDVQLWTRAMRNMGVTYSDLILGLDDLWNLQQNRRLRAAVATVTNTKAFLSPAEVDAQFAQFGITLKPYNSVYTLRTRDAAGIPTDTAYPILPTGKIVLMPRERVGYCGTVPQELNNWATGKYTWRNDPQNNPGMQDPIRHEMGVGWAGMPVIRFANRILVGSVNTPEEG